MKRATNITQESTTAPNQKADILLHGENCPVRKAMEIVGGKWKLFIIQQIGKKTLRYGEIKRAIPDITEKMLIQELKSLVEAGVIHKKSFGEIPPRVEYTLTEKGKKALPLLKHIKKFGEYLQEQG
ncbi:MAG: transcriptional regulator [Candidatus Kapaibacterium sp.]|nr:MAG: transcriptional regulator [Candidatus Kapabacteria bacterium]